MAPLRRLLLSRRASVSDYHEREAARLRELASTATTRQVKDRLLQEADQHARMARGEPPSDITDD